MNIAIIPARGGSKRIFKKNITQFLGKPIIGWSIEAALKSKIFDKVIVSTDDKEIAKIAEEYGAEVPFIRPSKLSDDFTATFPVIKHSIEWLNDKKDYDIKFVCCIYATAPLIQVSDLIDCYKMLLNSQKSFVFPVTQFSYPVQRALTLNADFEALPLWPDNKIKRSQDLEKTYHDAGQFYWGKVNAFIENHELFSSQSLVHVLPNNRVCDIDEPSDLIRAEIFFKAIHKISDKSR
jgi:pseudaminic acid cytidylyltransferase